MCVFIVVFVGQGKHDPLLFRHLVSPLPYPPLFILQEPGPSWSQGSDWPTFGDTVCRLQDVNFLTPGGLDWSTSSCRTSGGRGWFPTPKWMELGISPLVGRAVSRGVCGCSCGIRKSLSSLSADEWGCFPTYLLFGLKHPTTGA